MRKGALVVGISVAILAYSAGCSGKDELFRQSEILMGTVVEVTVADQSGKRARKAIRAALDEIRRIDELMSAQKPGSAVSRLNREGHERAIPLGNELFGLIRQAAMISEASGGAFDVTVGPLSGLWGFDQGGKLPATSDIAASLPLVGYKKLIFDNSTSSVGFSVQGMRVDLGAIAKGYAADRAVEKLREDGIRDAIVAVAGDLRIMGARPGKEFWKIGVQHPRENGRMLMTFELRDTAIDTSGDYERFFTVDGVRYHHLLDPATGMPARGCRSVTVLAPTATEADACATAAFVLGPEKGISFLRARPGVRGVIVDANGRLHWTDRELERMARP